MSYESKKAQDPEESRTFYSKELLGYTYSEGQPAAWDSVLSVLPTPPQQKVGNPNNRGEVEPFKEKVGEFQYIFYSPGEEQRPLWKCTEWIEWYAIPALLEHNLIQQGS
ncbi:Ff.00g003540.m01.CDS01 [Fusarium sp. VM40]|nr:Ff.00g003540.m01.CDS01 [Fusarium sp. VM40]